MHKRLKSPHKLKLNVPVGPPSAPGGKIGPTRVRPRHAERSRYVLGPTGSLTRCVQFDDGVCAATDDDVDVDIANPATTNSANRNLV